MAQRPVTPLLSLLNDPKWDAPFFKKLRKGESAEGTGKQSGLAIPKSNRDGNSAITPFFPFLDTNGITEEDPTVSRFLHADQFIGADLVATRPVRYQYQTYSNTRPTEARLTDLGGFYRGTGEDDFLLFQRDINLIDHYRIFLIKRQSALYNEVNTLAPFSRWGPFFPERLPISYEEMATAQSKMLEDAESPFEPVGRQHRQPQNQRMAIARSPVFREFLLDQYDSTCAVTGIQLRTPTAPTSSARLHEVEAAHIVPKKFGGSDDPRNGLTLCRTLHWAFDRGLFGVNDSREVIIPECVLAIPENGFLNKLRSKRITASKDPQLTADSQAFAWHRKEILLPRDSSDHHG